MDFKLKREISYLTDALVCFPEHGFELWKQNESISETLREEVIDAIGDIFTLTDRLPLVIKTLKQSPNKETRTTGKILRWSAVNFNLI